VGRCPCHGSVSNQGALAACSRSPTWFTCSSRFRAACGGTICTVCRFPRHRFYLVGGPLYQLLLVRRSINQHRVTDDPAHKPGDHGHNGRESATHRELNLFRDVYMARATAHDDGQTRILLRQQQHGPGGRSLADPGRCPRSHSGPAGPCAEGIAAITWSPWLR
jgi:hypothetical protein